ncbi:MAG: response regulator, partial [Chitinophagaceae bacterium]
MGKKKLHIAMLEDDSDDRYLTEEVLAELDFNLQIIFFSSSIDLLAGINSLLPDLILVDYNSTPQNGMEVLRILKANNNLSAVPVVILSDDKLAKYKADCYRLGANGFVIKPTSLAETKKKI